VAGGVFIVCQHAIADPDVTWPELKHLVLEALGKLGADHAQLGLLSPQDISVMEMLAQTYILRFRLYSLEQIMNEWMPNWADTMFDLALTNNVGVDWFPARKPRPPLDAWLLEDSIALLVLRTHRNPDMYQHLVREAHRRELPVVRIDPESLEARRVNPTKGSTP